MELGDIFCCEPKSKRKVTDFSIKAIMAERDSLVAETELPKKKLPKPRREVKVSRKSVSPVSSESEIPDTTTSDDVLQLPVLQKSGNFSQELANVQCHLEMKELWEKFNELGTEMIITRSGRRMFPTLRVSFSGLDVKSTYLVLLDIVTVDSKRYRYAYHRSSWLVAGKGDPAQNSKLYSHPDSPFVGEQLRKQIVTFEKVKLTNTEVNKPGYIVLNSMHRYQPRIHLVLDKGEECLSKSLKTFADLDGHEYKTFVFPECAFYSVTAYQNQLITKLKIDCNPFAKGFRDSTRVISDMERESMSDQFHSYPQQADSMNEFEAAVFSSKLAHFSRIFPEPNYHPNFKGFQPPQTSIPVNVLQKWSVGAWPSLPLEQRHLPSSVIDFQRQLLLAKHLAVSRMHPYFPTDNSNFGQKIKDSDQVE